MSIKVIALHLPQFHPIPENDKWWGKGFTEWTNVTKARPLFKGHYQPHLPADLGYYDLRFEEARIAQADMAKQHGIYGFCYYHYWFNGKRLLNRPLDDMMDSKTPDYPFMICWANENWTRRWDGMDSQVLIRQDYSTEDDKHHIRFLWENFFIDERYIRVEGKPFFAIYRPDLFPSIKKTIQTWREESATLGFGEMYIGCMQSILLGSPKTNDGFDCGIEFHPDFGFMPRRIIPGRLGKLFKRLQVNNSALLENKIFEYDEYVRNVLDKQTFHKNLYPGITPMWDNSARRKGGATILRNSTPEQYGHWLENLLEKYDHFEDENKFIFINAWNEWAEGNHLEPCQKWGRKYLEVTSHNVLKYA
jgi:lipopolysaccharide biosynthesis protein